MRRIARFMVLGVTIALATAVTTACGEGEGGSSEVSTDKCSSGLQWTGGDEGSSSMHPGRDCISCHASRGEGPRYAAAGTVFETFTEADDCYGAGGATVEIIDANQKVTAMTTDSAGNFYLRESDGDIAFPITARVKVGDKVRVMTTPQSTANCASCHTAAGANAAPGRIVVPL